MINEIKEIKEHEKELKKMKNKRMEIATRHFRGQENRQTSSRIVRIIGHKKVFIFALTKAIMKFLLY